MEWGVDASNRSVKLATEFERRAAQERRAQAWLEERRRARERWLRLYAFAGWVVAQLVSRHQRLKRQQQLAHTWFGDLLVRSEATV